VILVVHDVDEPAARGLETAQRAELGARYGGDGPAPVTAGPFRPPGGAFLVGWAGDRPVAAGGFRPLGDGRAELKAVRVEPDWRGRGLSRPLLRALEVQAARAGYRALWLSCGPAQHEALRLYASTGYGPVAAFGEFASDPLAVHLGKELAPPPPLDPALRPAAPDEVPAVAALLSRAARELRARGLDQWPDPFPADLVAASVARGETTLALEGAHLQGTLALSWSDEAFWGRKPPDAAYVHRLAVSPLVAGRGLGAALLARAGAEAARAGRPWLRLDCGADNAGLRAWYEGLGFAAVAEVTPALAPRAAPDGWRSALYQRPTGAPALRSGPAGAGPDAAVRS
jgi:ribosomal protein S18 acetylase RimI-like enzyme